MNVNHCKNFRLYRQKKLNKKMKRIMSKKIVKLILKVFMILKEQILNKPINSIILMTKIKNHRQLVQFKKQSLLLKAEIYLIS